jgi:hypothetical protein
MVNKKYFVFDSGERLTKEEKERLRKADEIGAKLLYESQRKAAIEKISEEDDLCHVEGRVVIKIDIDSKDSWTFEDGTKIEYKRRFNNFNQREASPVNAIVISGEGITKNSEILIHPNAVHDSNRIFDYKDSNDNVRYYSIHNDMCFAWHDGENWRPLYPFEFALNVFRTYAGKISNIDPTQLKDTLYVLTGELAGKVVKTIPFSAYVIIFQGKGGREEQLLRFRPFGDNRPKKEREEEAVAILENETKEVLKNKLLVGIEISDAKTLKEYAN